MKKRTMGLNLSQEQYKKLGELADAAGITRTAYVRVKVFGKDANTEYGKQNSRKKIKPAKKSKK